MYHNKWNFIKQSNIKAFLKMAFDENTQFSMLKMFKEREL